MKLELAVFGIIAIIVILLSFTVSIPEDINTPNNNGVIIDPLQKLGDAPELVGTQEWINSEPLSIKNLKGKVVLIDFWTYSCINCIRTLPFINEWHEKYADKGLIIIAVHTPEFEFEKDINNVKAAVEKYDIKHAVVQDNDYATWRAYNNRFWPRKYLIGKDGNIRYDHIGEGAYKETEEVIQQLLKETNVTIDENTTDVSSTPRLAGTPELYLGYNFIRAPLGNEEGISPNNIVNYTKTEISLSDIIYLEGKWENKADNVVAIENSKLFLKYTAKEVNIVAGGTGKITILIDGEPVNDQGTDITVEGGKTIVNINSQQLYNIISSLSHQSHLLEIQAEPGFELYTFTFG